MACDCDNSNSVPNCFTNLIIGEVVNANVDYWVYFKRADGSMKRYPSVDIVYTYLIGVNNAELRCGEVYEVFVTRQNTDDISDRVGFTPNEATAPVTCVSVKFDYCADLHDTQTITLQ